ncbi:MAG: phenylalanine--tRNA ligase subunit beta [Clostridia bacterium]|nr:phenylalanine--tRNA ligase subunit beta [Clostridia bacterium]
MKLPYKWIRDYTDVNADAKTYAARLTMTGSKIEKWENYADNIKNVVCARILSVKEHPDSDHLMICMMDTGAGEPVQVVSGAPNLRAGDLVPMALDGALLPGGVEIKRTVMRGEESRGMLCSMSELGLTEHDCPYGDPNGILVLPAEFGAKEGDDICQVLALDEEVFDFEITPNRPDCLSVIGLARESAASFDRPFSLHEPVVKADASDDIRNYLEIEISDPDLCPRYAAAMVKNIRIEPSPKWMRDRLRAAGVRPINNIVDITNYVMLEYGQPMHAFDYACIAEKKIIVRRSRDGERIVTLDGKERELWPETLLITDPTKAIGIAGVMGGENSEITENTKMIVFESATFSGPSVRTSSRRIGLRSEASGRFEKGLDCENAMPALLRACELIGELGAGTVIGGVIDAYPNKKQRRVIPLDPAKICAFIGADISEEFMRHSLLSLGFEIDGYDILVPFWRDDVEGTADIAEEVTRIYGYDRIPSTLVRGETTKGGFDARQRFDRVLERACLAAGYYETKTFTFIGPRDLDRICLPANSPLRLALPIMNPLGEDQSIMRTTPLPSMLEAVMHNCNHRTERLRLFEPSMIFLPQIKDGKPDVTTLPLEKKILTMAMYGDGDFYTIKGNAEAVLRAADAEDWRFLPCTDDPSYHPGRCAAISCGGQIIGRCGQIHPQVLENYGIGVPVYAAEMDMSALYALSRSEKIYRAVPKYPAVTRDLAVICDERIYALQLEDVIRAAAGSALEKLELFDVYRGAQIGADKKSIAFSLTLRSPDHTMTDAESDAIMANILKRLGDECGAVLRA